MPIYEFRCADCGKVTNHFTRKIDTEVKANCEHCGSAKTSRMMSKFGRSYTRADIIDRYGDASDSNNPDAYRDPRQIGSWVEKRFEEYGMEPTSLDQLRDGCWDVHKRIDDMDVNCGDVLDGVSISDKAKEIFAKMLEVASGVRSSSHRAVSSSLPLSIIPACKR